ncbi:MAG: RluA family pseudouridine synthase [Treponema sp.]|nr:RluA family pseudouridine synthase [Treponema sp.]
MSEKLTFTSEETQRLDEFLRLKLPQAVGEASLSNSKIRRLIAASCVSVNGRPVTRPAYELRGRSFITVIFDRKKFFYEKQPDDLSFTLTDKDILFEDDKLIFVNKPAFFPVEQTITGNRANLHDTLVDYLWARDKSLRNPPYVGIMHRLDRETSGVIVFTKTRAVNKALHDVFEKHLQQKEYIAISVPKRPKGGTPIPGTEFTIEKFMGRISGKSQTGKWGALSEFNGGQYSKTDFYVNRELTIEGKTCLEIKCSLYTGRTHQIRVHLSEEGLPIMGDALYGGENASRLYLHSNHLAFTCDGISYDVFSPLPW